MSANRSTAPDGGWYCSDFWNIRLEGPMFQILQNHARLKRSRPEHEVCKKACLACKVEDQLNALAMSVFEAGGLLTGITLDKDCKPVRNLPAPAIRIPKGDYSQMGADA